MIRVVKASDIKNLMQLIEDSIYQADPDAVPSEHYILEAITMSMKPKTLLYLKVCERDDKIVGFSLLKSRLALCYPLTKLTLSHLTHYQSMRIA